MLVAMVGEASATTTSISGCGDCMRVVRGPVKRECGPTLRDAIHDLSGNFESGRQAGRERGRKVDGHF